MDRQSAICNGPTKGERHIVMNVCLIFICNIGPCNLIQSKMKDT